MSIIDNAPNADLNYAKRHERKLGEPLLLLGHCVVWKFMDLFDEH